MAKIQTTILKELEAVHEIASMYGLRQYSHITSDEQKHFRYLRKRLHLEGTEQEIFVQCAILAQMFDNDYITTNKDMAELLRVSHISMLSNIECFNRLKRQQMIRVVMIQDHSNPVARYILRREFVKAALGNADYSVPSFETLNVMSILRQINEMLCETSRNSSNYDQMVLDINYLLEHTQHTQFSSILVEKRLLSAQLVLLLIAIKEMVLNHCNYIVQEDYEDILSDSMMLDDMIEELQEGRGPLTCWLENYTQDGLVQPNNFSLTSNAIDALLAEFKIQPITQRPMRHHANMIDCDKIAAKQLYYNAAEEQQITRLADLLQAENFLSIQQRLKEEGMRTGVCVMLHGVAGGGKTETVLQLARQTGRALFKVDVSDVKNKYVGDSEKNIRQIFDRYERVVDEAVKANRPCPIMLLNEADGLLSRRMKGAENAVDKMENSIQNLILEAMERISGIMIATSNLADTNLDPAFERRFLIKVHFDKPAPEVRAKIWQSMMPALSADDAAALAREFPFTGGEIENITRKHAIDRILYGKRTSLADLRILCKEESCTQKRSVGFC